VTTIHNKLDRWRLLIVVIVGGPSATPCHHVADEAAGRRKQIDGTVSVCDERGLHPESLQHLHLPITRQYQVT